MRYFFMLSTIFTIISGIVLAMQEVGSLNFLVTMIGMICCLIVAIVSGIIIGKNSRRSKQ